MNDHLDTIVTQMMVYFGIPATHENERAILDMLKRVDRAAAEAMQKLCIILCQSQYTPLKPDDDWSGAGDAEKVAFWLERQIRELPLDSKEANNMDTLRNIAKKVVIIQGGGDVEQVELQLQKQIAAFEPNAKQAEALAHLGVEHPSTDCPDLPLDTPDDGRG